MAIIFVLSTGFCQNPLSFCCATLPGTYADLKNKISRHGLPISRLSQIGAKKDSGARKGNSVMSAMAKYDYDYLVSPTGVLLNEKIHLENG